MQNTSSLTPNHINFQNLFESSPDCYIVLSPDPAFLILAVSDAYLRVTLTERSRLLGRPLFEVFPSHVSQNAARANQNIRTSLEHVIATRTSSELTVQRYDIPRAESQGGGYEEQYWNICSVPVLDANGTVLQIIHRVHDITAVVRAQNFGNQQQEMNASLKSQNEKIEALVFQRTKEIQALSVKLLASNRRLQESESRVRAFFHQADAFLGLLSTEGVLLEANLAYSIHSGFPQSASIGKPFWEAPWWVGLPLEVEKLKEDFRNARQGQASRRDCVYRSADNTLRYVSKAMTPVVDSSGQLTAVLVTGFDITDRKLAEDELRINRERLALAHLAGQTGSFEWDIQKDINTWSPEIEALYGLEPGSFKGTLQAWEECVFPEDLPAAKQALERSVETGELLAEWRVHRRNDGKLRWLRCQAKVLFDVAGRPQRMLGINVDITDVKEAEEVRRRLHEELERLVAERTLELNLANQSLRELSGRLLRLQDDERRRIARELHDSVGQLLAALSMNISVVRGEIQSLSPRAQRCVTENSTLVEQMLSEIRTLSYLLHPPLLDEVGLASALNWYVTGFSERSGIQVNLKFGADFLRLSKDLETGIFRIVQECLTNIHRHSGSKHASISLEHDERVITVIVEDQGVGIPPQQLQLMQSDGTSGVGLRGMRERIREFNGTMEISSEAGGTKILVRLPIPPGGDSWNPSQLPVNSPTYSKTPQ